jgi:hypothetical protein
MVCVAALMLGPAVVTVCTATGAEPTSAEIEALVKQRLNAHAEASRHATASCGRASASVSDPAAALICLGGALMGPGNPVGSIRITQFEKLGCTPASGAPGVVCDYRVSLSTGAAALRGPQLAAIVGPGGVARARFVRSKESWEAIFNESP